VFAETEIISLLASGTTPEDISAGVFRSIAQRVAALAHRESNSAVVFTGGAARIQGMDRFLSQALGRPVVIAPDPHLTAARGAALFACEQIEPSRRGRDE
jgi:activator of 2-hydroxyglutaryl-CoA dehydratase